MLSFLPDALSLNPPFLIRFLFSVLESTTAALYEATSYSSHPLVSISFRFFFSLFSSSFFRLVADSWSVVALLLPRWRTHTLSREAVFAWPLFGELPCSSCLFASQDTPYPSYPLSFSSSDSRCSGFRSNPARWSWFLSTSSTGCSFSPFLFSRAFAFPPLPMLAFLAWAPCPVRRAQIIFRSFSLPDARFLVSPPCP